MILETLEQHPLWLGIPQCGTRPAGGIKGKDQKELTQEENDGHVD